MSPAPNAIPTIGPTTAPAIQPLFEGSEFGAVVRFVATGGGVALMSTLLEPTEDSGVRCGEPALDFRLRDCLGCSWTHYWAA